MGFNTEIDESVITQIWERAGEFFPILKQVSLKELNKSREVRVGLRPYSMCARKNFAMIIFTVYIQIVVTDSSFMLFYFVLVPDGKPVIDHVPRISNMFLAAGHEGEGLTLVIFSFFSSLNNVLVLRKYSVLIWCTILDNTGQYNEMFGK